MRLSYTQIRNAGLGLLLLLIFLEGLFSYLVLATHSDRVKSIVSQDEEQLKKWYAVSEIMDEAKDRLYDFQLDNIHSLAVVDLLLRRAQREVVELKTQSSDDHELSDIEELLHSAERFGVMLANYRQIAHNLPPDDPQRLGIAEQSLQMANRMALLGRSAVVTVNDRISAKHKDLQHLTGFSKRFLMLGLLLATCATMTVAFVAARALAAPISQLVEGTQKLAAGDLAHQVDIRTKDEIGKLAKAFNSMADQLQRSRHELVAAKQYTDNILRSMLNCLVVVDGAGAIIRVNESTCQLLGFQKEELYGKPLASVFAHGYFEKFGFEDSLEKGGAQQETAFQTKTGKIVPMLLSSSALRDADGEINGLVCVAQDITVHAETMRAGHLASLGELAAGVAHEINNPMNSIINFAQLMLDEVETEGKSSSTELLERIINEGDRVSLIVRSLLAFARDESEKKHLLIRLEDIVDETLTLSGMQLRKDGILLDHRIEGVLPMIHGHFQQLQQVVLNVLNNARYALNQKFPGHHPGKRLCLTLKQTLIDDRLWVIFECVDFGTGIPAEVLKKVKNPFFSTKPAGSGTGLGLTISHGIVTDHGGKLQLESEDGDFTRVTLMLPASANDA